MSDANTVRLLKTDTQNVTPAQIEAWMKGSSQDQAKAIKAMQEMKRKTVEEENKNKTSRPRGKGVQLAIETLVANNPKIKGKELYDALKAKGIESSATSIDSYRSLFIHSMKTLHELGLLNEKGIAVINKV